MNQRDRERAAKIRKEMRKAQKLRGGHAPYWNWHKQGTLELNVAGVLITLLNRSLGINLRGVRSRDAGDDPPDCEASTSDGRRVGIEVMELVDEQTAWAAHELAKPRPPDKTKKGRRKKVKKVSPVSLLEMTEKEWSRDELITRLQKCITRKGAPAAVRGGPYAAYLLAIPTDEDSLVIGSRLESLLSGHSFSETGILTAAFVVTAPAPAHCRVVRLPFSSDEPGALNVLKECAQPPQ